MHTRFINLFKALPSILLALWTVDLSSDYMWELPAIWRVGLALMALFALVYTVQILDLLHALWQGHHYRVIDILKIKETALADIWRLFYLCEAPDGTTTILSTLVYGAPLSPAFLCAYRSPISNKRAVVAPLPVLFLSLKTGLCYLLILTTGYLFRHG